MTEYLWLIIALPLAGALFLHFFGRFLAEPLPGWLATAAIGGSFVVALVAALPVLRRWQSPGDDPVVGVDARAGRQPSRSSGTHFRR